MVAQGFEIRRAPLDLLGGWDGSARDARRLQSARAASVQLSDGFHRPPRTIAGFSVTTVDGGETVRAAGVLLDAQTLQPLHQRVVDVPSQARFRRTLLDFRVLPALLDALSALHCRPDLAFVDGHGIAHPRRLGVASHFGLASGLPTIGVARERLTGGHAEPGDTAGDSARLYDGDQQVGWAVRTRSGASPVFVSPGHKVSLASALELALRFGGRHRLPVPAHLAQQLVAQSPRPWPPVTAGRRTHAAHSSFLH